MAKLVFVVGNDARRMPDLLRAQAETLAADAQSNRLGLGYYQTGRALVAKRPIEAKRAIPFADLCGNVSATALVGQVLASEQPFTEAAMPPYRHRNWLFGHDGYVAHFDNVREALKARVPEHMIGRADEHTDSELIFLYVLGLMERAHNLDDAEITAEAAAKALADGLTQVQIMSRQNGDESILNCVLTNGRVAVAARAGAPLATCLQEGLPPLPSQVTSPDGNLAESMRRYRGVVIASYRGDAPRGFTEVRDGSLVLVGPSLEISTQKL